MPPLSVPTGSGQGAAGAVRGFPRPGGFLLGVCSCCVAAAPGNVGNIGFHLSGLSLSCLAAKQEQMPGRGTGAGTGLRHGEQPRTQPRGWGGGGSGLEQGSCSTPRAPRCSHSPSLPVPGARKPPQQLPGASPASFPPATVATAPLGDGQGAAPAFALPRPPQQVRSGVFLGPGRRQESPQPTGSGFKPLRGSPAKS